MCLRKTRQKTNQQSSTKIFMLLKNKFPAGLLFKVFILTFFVANDIRLALIIHEKESLPPIALVLVYIASLLSVVVLFLNKNRVIRTVTEIFLFTAVFTDMLYIIMAGYPFSFPDAINLFNNPGYAPNALATFRFAFSLAFILAITAFMAVKFSFRSIQSTFHVRWTLPALLIYL